MPNHVQNVLTFSSRESLEKVMNALKPGWTEEDGFKFEWVVPFPNSKEECPQEYICEDPAAAHIQEDAERPWYHWNKGYTKSDLAFTNKTNIKT